MKKGIYLVLIAGLLASMLASCSGRKCEICGKKATEKHDGKSYCETCVYLAEANDALGELGDWY